MSKTTNRIHPANPPTLPALCRAVAEDARRLEALADEEAAWYERTLLVRRLDALTARIVRETAQNGPLPKAIERERLMRLATGNRRKGGRDGD